VLFSSSSERPDSSSASTWPTTELFSTVTPAPYGKVLPSESNVTSGTI
jgi:hypothetical protein